MNRVFLVIALMFIFILMEFYNADRFIGAAMHDRLKNVINYAAHDASLQVDPNYLVEGQIVFLRNQALETFETTFIDNFNLEADLSPKSGQLFDSPVEIMLEDFVDDLSGVTFPYLYTNGTYGISQIIDGPSVIYTIRVKVRKISTLSYDGYIYKHVIFEYPYPN